MVFFMLIQLEYEIAPFKKTTYKIILFYIELI